MAEIRTRKMASTKKSYDGLAKLRSAPVLKGKLHPLLQLHAIVSSPVFVGENLARFGTFKPLIKIHLWLRCALFADKHKGRSSAKKLQADHQEWRTFCC